MSFSRSIDREQAQKCHDYDHEEHHLYGAQCEAPPSLARDIDEFQRLIGVEFDFHGSQGNSVRLNNCVYEFLRDPDDGYRSHLGAVSCTPASDHTGYFPNPIARVILVATDDEESWPDEWTPPQEENHEAPFHGYYFVDTDDFHVWAQIGTEYYDAYYPMFITRYTPKRPLEA